MTDPTDDPRSVAPALVDRFERGAWTVERWSGAAGALHSLDWPDPLGPTVWVLEVDRPALVLGSSQPAEDVDVDALASDGIEVARRRSGGGAVLLEPANGVWIDVLIPRRHARWDDDVNRAFGWLGQTWVEALGDLGIVADVHRGALACGTYGKQVCFAALGPGEVTVGGAKAVGLSQRRTRAGARFQCCCFQRWRPAPLAALGIDPAALPEVAAIDRTPAAMVDALLARLDGPA